MKQRKTPRQLMSELNSAIQQRDKKAIITAYDKLEKVDWHKVGFATSEEYDALVDKANEILYS